MGDGAPDLSLVIPLYRDEDALPAIFARCGRVLDDHGGTGELVLVDDGSRDRTAARAVELGRAFEHETTVVRLTRNVGQHAAVFAGLAHARGTAVVTLDSDLQYPPEDIPLLLAELSPQQPVVSGYREDRRDPFPRRVVTGALTRWLNRRLGVSLRDFGSMFRAYDRPTVDLMLTLSERHRFVPAIVAWLGIPIKEVPVSHAPRSASGTRYRIGGLVELLFDMVTGYSVFPMRMLTVLGLLASLVGLFATCGFIAYRVVVGAGVSGAVSAFALIFGLLTVQLMIVALLGEYVGRIYVEAKGRPYYVVGEVRRFPGRTAVGAPP
jgi:undecaprenyl-phosphate 4-deoxy-4-formamido-L-arabinose transferase